MPPLDESCLVRANIAPRAPRRPANQRAPRRPAKRSGLRSRLTRCVVRKATRRRLVFISICAGARRRLKNADAPCAAFVLRRICAAANILCANPRVTRSTQRTTKPPIRSTWTNRSPRAAADSPLNYFPSIDRPFAGKSPPQRCAERRIARFPAPFLPI